MEKFTIVESTKIQTEIDSIIAKLSTYDSEPAKQAISNLLTTSKRVHELYIKGMEPNEGPDIKK